MPTRIVQRLAVTKEGNKTTIAFLIATILAQMWDIYIYIYIYIQLVFGMCDMLNKEIFDYFDDILIK